MANHEPSVGLIWKYDKTDGILKIQTTIFIEVEVNEENVIVDSTVPGFMVGVIECTVTTNPPHSDTSPVKKVVTFDVEDIGQNKTETQVKVKILENSPYEVIVSVNKDGEIPVESTAIASEKTKLDYS